MPTSPESMRPRALIRRRTEFPVVDPGVFLHRFEGEPRGFWGRGDRWVAWAGCLREFRIEGPSSEPEPRFAAIRDRLDALLRSARVETTRIGGEAGGASDEGLEDRPRLFGGFSFLDSDPGDPSWEGFPSARFVLPRVLLRGQPDGCELTVQGFDPDPLDSLLDRLDDELCRHRDALLDTPTPPRVLVPRAAETLTEDNGAERRSWDDAVRAVLDAVHEGRVDKAVLARIQDLELEREPGVGDLVRFLRHENPRAHVFLVQFAPERALFGAAPEVLAELRGGHVHATAVAGSIGRGQSPEGDRRQAASLLASEKDRAEHRMTVDEMREVLVERVEAMDVAAHPRILTLARIQHLESPIEGRVREGQDVLSLVEALHPTPAVCGRPRSAALELIREREPFERGWYAGPVGWLDSAGDGDFVPALRVGVGGGRHWRLFAGAGIVEGSDPRLEWEETALKFEPALRALRAGAASSVPVGDSVAEGS